MLQSYENGKDMKIPINELHGRAMLLADEAHLAKKKKDVAMAESKFLAAFEYEKAAAMLLVNDYQQEPSRSVLFRSAACLLLNLPFPTYSQLRQAEQMVAYGLSGTPPEEIAQELREVWKDLMLEFRKTAA